MRTRPLILFLITAGLVSCIFVVPDQKKEVQISESDSGYAAKKDSLTNADSLNTVDSSKNEVTHEAFFAGKEIHTKNIHPQQLVEFAKTLIGTPYRYASTDPKTGFDCSGFITYVFKHFDIIVPRSSIDFTNVGRAVPRDSARTGDLILFTGTDSTEKFVGHMGLVTSNEKNSLSFIHSTSGKAYGVTITPFSSYYQSRYMKTIRIFPQNDK